MAQQAFEDIAAAVMQAESRGKRYKDDGKTLTTSPKGALGEMQVMPKTIRDPGFGVIPARDKSPDEIARVGQDYLQAMLSRYGDTETALVAYNWGPGSTDKWIAAGAKPEKLPDETKTYVQRVKGFLGGASTPASSQPQNVSRETPVAVPREPLPPSLPPMAAATKTPAQPSAPDRLGAGDRLAALGPSYQAAFALSFLADTDDKEDRDIDREPGIAEKYLAEMEAVPRSTALAELSNTKIRSPFAEPQPQMLADGGDVGDESELDERPTKKEIQAAQEQYPDLPPSQAVYMFRGGNRYGNSLSGNIGARIPLGEDTDATLMLSGSRSENNPSSSKAMLAMLNQRIGEGNVGATLVRPTDAPNGLYAGSLSGSYPLGDGRITGSVNALRTPDGQIKMSGYGIGYGGRVGPGDLSVGVSRQGNSGPFSGQLSYRIPIGRAGGSPEEGEQALTQEEIKFATQQPPVPASLPPARSAKELDIYIKALNPSAAFSYFPERGGTLGYVGSRFPDILNIQKNLNPQVDEEVKLHELEHSLALRSGDTLGRPNVRTVDNNYKAYYMLGSWQPLSDFTKNMVNNREKLEKFFGRPLKDTYFLPETLEAVGKQRGGDTSALFDEQMASLSALEQITGKSLTRDPEMKKLFPSTQVMSVFDALTGPRQTRLDARDLPPSTPQPAYVYRDNPVTKFLHKIRGDNFYPYDKPVKRAGGSPEEGEQAPTAEELEAASKPAFITPSSGRGRKISTKPGELEAAALQGVSEYPYLLAGEPANLNPLSLQNLMATGGMVERRTDDNRKYL